MEDVGASFIYAAACAGIHAGKPTYFGHQEMMYELYEWIMFKRPAHNWHPWSSETLRYGWLCT